VLGLISGTLADAAASFARSRATFQRLGDLHGLACVLSDEAALYGYQNRLAESVGTARQAITIFEQVADPVAAVLAAPALSAALRGLGRLAEALAVDDAAVDRARRRHAAEIVLARALNSLAMTRLLRGEARLAYGAAQEAADLLRAVGDRYVLLAALRHLASAAVELGRRREAVRLLRRSHDLAVSWIGDGRAAAAVPVLRRCVRVYDEMDIRPAQSATLEMLARAYEAVGDRSAAGDARRAARVLGDPPDFRTAALSGIVLRLAESVAPRR
jgi:tetratricopeptide (TPR) repeat protein